MGLSGPLKEAFRLWVGKPLSYCHLPSCCHLSWQRHPEGEEANVPASAPKSSTPARGGEAPESAPGHHVDMEAAREARANLEKTEASAGGRRKREGEKELLMHIMSVELSMTN